MDKSGLERATSRYAQRARCSASPIGLRNGCIYTALTPKLLRFVQSIRSIFCFSFSLFLNGGLSLHGEGSRGRSTLYSLFFLTSHLLLPARHIIIPLHHLPLYYRAHLLRAWQFDCCVSSVFLWYRRYALRDRDHVHQDVYLQTQHDKEGLPGWDYGRKKRCADSSAAVARSHMTVSIPSSGLMAPGQTFPHLSSSTTRFLPRSAQ